MNEEQVQIVLRSILPHVYREELDKEEYGYNAYGEETVTGNLHLGKDSEGDFYLRVVTPKNKETGYWEQNEWLEDPSVMQTIMEMSRFVGEHGLEIDQLLEKELTELGL
jgi:hypothetical protein